MKDPMKSRDKSRRNEPRRADRAKPDHGRKRAYQQAHTGRGFSENAGAASRTGRGAASRGAFHVLSFAPCAGAFFKAAGRSRRARLGAYRRGTDPKSLEKAVRRAQEAAASKAQPSRLQFTDEERATPELEKYIKKSDKAADRLDAARAALPPKKKSRLQFDKQETPPSFEGKRNPLSRPAQGSRDFRP